MKVRTPALVVLSAGLVAGAIIAGTSSARSSDAQRPAGRTATAKSFTFFDYGSTQNPAAQKLVHQYEQETGVDVQYVTGPSSQANAWIITQLAGGTAPDMITLGTNEQPWPHVKKGWYDDLTKYALAPDPYVKGNKRWIDLLTPGAARLLRFADGKIYALSTTGFDVAFIYNKAIFSKLHLTVPKTWAQMFAAFQKIKSAGYIPLDWELGSHGYGGQTEQFITILEGTVMHASIARMDKNKDGVIDVKEIVRGIKNGTYSARNPDYQESWKLMKALKPYMQLGASATSDPDKGFNLFKSGRVATWFEGSYNTAKLADTNIKWGAFVLPRITKATSRFATSGPQPTGGFGACCGYPWAIALTAEKSGNVTAAMDFIYWMSTPKHTDEFAAGGGVLSMERDAAPLSPSLKPFGDAAAHVSALATAELSLPPQFIGNRATLVDQYVTGTISLATAMSRMQKEMNAAATLASKQYGLPN
jgi:ABC-type glycerol-3-phosphate transport system substrate-binding protein